MIAEARWLVLVLPLTACWMGAVPARGEDGDPQGEGGLLGDDSLEETDTDGHPIFEEADGGVLDSSTGLVWQDPPAHELMIQFTARDYCRELVQGGKADWYLPDLTQLKSLLRQCGDGCPLHDPSCLHIDCADPAACHGCTLYEGPGQDGCYWPGWSTGWCHKYWSYSQQSLEYNSFWLVDFRDGSFVSQDQMWTAAVRCVRDPA